MSSFGESLFEGMQFSDGKFEFRKAGLPVELVVELVSEVGTVSVVIDLLDLSLDDAAAEFGS